MTVQAAPIVSVVICTHNRLGLLMGCIKSLASQQADPAHYEVIVVDNSSSDGTSEFLKSYEPGLLQFRWVSEPLLGLSHARNRGWREACGTYVAYIDDDAEATTGWMSAILSFVARYPDATVFGGPFSAFSTDPVPAWFPPEYGTMDLGSEERILLVDKEYVVGLNMAFHRDALLANGGFHLDLGMKGNIVSYGEETHLQILLQRQGLDVYYLPHMKVRHYLPAYKMRFAWLLKSVYAVGKCWSLTSSRPRSLFYHLSGLAYGCFYLVRTFVKNGKMPFRRRLYYALVPFISECGSLMNYLLAEKRGILKGKRDKYSYRLLCF